MGIGFVNRDTGEDEQGHCYCVPHTWLCHNRLIPPCTLLSGQTRGGPKYHWWSWPDAKSYSLWNPANHSQNQPLTDFVSLLFNASKILDRLVLKAKITSHINLTLSQHHFRLHFTFILLTNLSIKQKSAKSKIFYFYFQYLISTKGRNS